MSILNYLTRPRRKEELVPVTCSFPEGDPLIVNFRLPDHAALAARFGNFSLRAVDSSEPPVIIPSLEGMDPTPLIARLSTQEDLLIVRPMVKREHNRGDGNVGIVQKLATGLQLAANRIQEAL